MIAVVVVVLVIVVIVVVSHLSSLRFSTTYRHHECEIFSESEPEAAESGYKWKNCEKNPGHVKFISAPDFTENYLSKLHSEAQREVLQARVDLTVRLRVNWTSQDRQDDDEFSAVRGTKLRRFGTGCILDVSYPVDDEPCPCPECDEKIVRKHWAFPVLTARHVVYDTEEAKQTKVDLFYDDESCEQNGRMKTLWGLEVLKTSVESDECTMLCVTHDEDLGERLESICRCVHGSEPGEPFNLADLGWAESCGKDYQHVMVVSHPHGQPKKITVGEVVRETEEAGTFDNPAIFYNTPTCAGSSGAPLNVFGKTPTLLYYFWYSSVHSGRCGESSTDPCDQLNFGLCW
ncbi:hypothetical protein ElyMa_005820800 [Elysia marginata]|uniref:Peptidase S1 domain-containing protein n=1 Tax=Elysia marginata TaxID=1093978 RepID=A0AAV4FW04_9GAST|nr:hypothetical protein ElyMa_005820800 [Elysia marginata]